MATGAPLLLLMLLLAILGAGAQQDYNEEDKLGYVCSGADSCQAYAAYRALRNDTLRTLGTRFGLSVEQVAQASRLPTTASISDGQLLLVPLNCSCVAGRSHFNTTYIVQEDDTFAVVSNGTFLGLTTWQAAVAANPSMDPQKLLPGDHVTFPIRCACPSSSQRQAGTRSLVTYSIWTGDTVANISADWNLSTSDVLSENKSPDVKKLALFTTLLLPLKTDGPPALPTSSRSRPAPASPAPPSSSPTPSGSSSGNSRLSTGAIVGIAVAAVTVALLLAAFGLFCVRRARNRVKGKGKQSGGGSPYAEKTSLTNTQYSSSFDVSGGSKNQHRELIDAIADMLDSDKQTLFSYTELLKATDDFSPKHRIQGSVYSGVFGGQTVAIKEMKSGATSQELRILAKVHHMNLVRLIGLGSGGDKLFFVYEYAENGSLSNYLQAASDSDSASSTAALLNWNTRLQIALDVASGLEYIHDYTKPSFVHKDIKSTNILLDSNFRAKIANFGMARLVESSRDGSSIPPAALTSHVTGTQGYMAPEYLAHGFVSPKLDVFAFGVVLLELITGREAVLNNSRDTRSRFLSDVFVGLMQGGDPETKLDKIKQWLDPSLDQAVPWDIIYSLVLLARSCVDEDPAARPSMKDVTFALSKAGTLPTVGR